jgi:hypothetical protein
MAKPTAVQVGGWLATILKFLGLAAETAAAVAPVFTDNQKTQADLNKAKVAGQAAGQLADSVIAQIAAQQAAPKPPTL